MKNVFLFGTIFIHFNWDTNQDVTLLEAFNVVTSYSFPLSANFLELCDVKVYMFLYLNQGWSVLEFEVVVLKLWKDQHLVDLARRFSSLSLVLAL